MKKSICAVCLTDLEVIEFESHFLVQHHECEKKSRCDCPCDCNSAPQEGSNFCRYCVEFKTGE